jgi:hypothetical protein
MITLGQRYNHEINQMISITLNTVLSSLQETLKAFVKSVIQTSLKTRGRCGSFSEEWFVIFQPATYSVNVIIQLLLPN